MKKYNDNYQISNLRDRLIYDSITSLKDGVIELNTFINNTVYFENIFSTFSCQKMEFLPVYKILKEHNTITDLVSKNSVTNLSFSEIHQLEIQYKKRFFNGRRIVSNIGYLNKYVQKNIEEYYSFIDVKLEELYGNKYSLLHTLFGELKSVDEINIEFPNKFQFS